MKLVAEIKIEPDQLREFLKKYLMDNGYDVTKITFEVGMQYDDHPCGGSTPEFRCAKAIVTRSEPGDIGVPAHLGWGNDGGKR